MWVKYFQGQSGGLRQNIQAKEIIGVGGGDPFGEKKTRQTVFEGLLALGNVFFLTIFWTIVETGMYGRWCRRGRALMWQVTKHVAGRQRVESLLPN